MNRGAGNAAVGLAVVLVAGGVAVGAHLLDGESPLPTAGGRVHLDGTASVVRSDGSAGALRDGDIVHPGDEIEVTDGTMVLELAAGGAVEGRAGHDGADDSLLEVGAPVRLLAGDLLATGPSGVAVDAAGTIVTLDDGDDGDGAEGESAARVSRDLAVTTSTYLGAVAVDSAGEHRVVDALRELSVSSVGRLPADVEPVRTDATDPWDLRYLGEAIDLTRRLDTLSRSFTVLGTDLDVDDLGRLLPAVGDAGDDDVDPSMLAPDRRAGETIVGAAIATRTGGPGSLAERWHSVFSFRDDGATWGLVALDHGVDGVELLADVEAALGRTLGTTSGEVANGSPGGGSVAGTPTGAGAGAGAGGAAPGPTTGPGGGTSVTVPPGAPVPPTLPTTPPTLPPTTLPPPPEGLPPPVDDVLDGLLDPVEDLLGGLLG